MAFGFLKKAVRATRRAAGGAIRGAAKGVGSVGKAVGKVPVVGGGLRGAFNLTAAAPFKVAATVSKGGSINKIASNVLRQHVADVKEVAPYAQAVISNVPGVGQGVSGAIGASLALASGQPISKAIAQGVRDALPGGPLAKSAFDIGAAAAAGKPISKIALAALPISAQQKDIVARGLTAVNGIAKGKPIDKLIADQALGALPPDLRKAATTGIALANAKDLQKLAPSLLKPTVLPTLKKGGLNLIKTSPMLSAAGKVLDPAGREGYAMGVGLMARGPLTPIQLTAIRKKMTAAQRKGFDIALATRIGMIEKPVPKHATPAQQFGYFAANGIKSLPSNKAKVTLLKKVASKPDTMKGASEAVKEARKEHTKWWKRVLKAVGFKTFQGEKL